MLPFRVRVANERVLQSSSITRISPSDCLVSYPGHSLGGGLTTLQRCSQVYSTASANWAMILKDPRQACFSFANQLMSVETLIFTRDPISY